MYPQFDIAQTKLNFGNKSVETKHKVTCNDLSKQNMDHIYTDCAYCRDQKYDLHVSTAYCHMCTEFHHTKQLVLRDHKKVSQESGENNDIKKVVVRNKRKKHSS